MVERTICRLCAAVLVAAGAAPASAEVITLRVVAWNVESGDADPEVISERIVAEDGVDIWGLSEVAHADDAETFAVAAEDGESADFEAVVGTTGGQDRLVIVYDTTRLEQKGVQELHAMNIGGNVRAPLVAHFRGKTTGKEFLFMVNHLYRGSAAGRHTQSQMLNAWAKEQELPVIAVGDVNYDWHFQTGDTDHDDGYDLLTKDAVFTWVRPDVLVPTNASGHKSVLDFVFVSGEAAGWTFESQILVQTGDFPDDAEKSDHRPVDCLFTLDTAITPPPGPGDGSSRAQLLQRLATLEQELQALRELIENLPE
jgi:endonuclease/exonuclease/phosphatase family metal-dependent hydrolase